MTAPIDGASSVPVVSVVMPAYRAAATIPAQLNALAEQDFDEPWEVVVVDDASPDATADIAESYRSRLPMLRVVRLPENCGQNHARNVGAAQSTGPLLLFCDADDVVTPGWVRGLVAALQIGDAAAGSFEVDSLNPRRLISQEYKPRPGQTDPGPPAHLLPSASSSSCGVRKKVWEALGGFDERIRWGGGDDTDFFWRLQLAGYHIAAAPDALVARRLRPTLRSSIRQEFSYAYAVAQLERSYGPHRPRAFTTTQPRRRPFWRRSPATAAVEIGWRAGTSIGWLFPDRDWSRLPVPGQMPPPLSSAPVAIVIPAWRSWATIDAVLDSLADQLRSGDEVVVVESSGDGRAAQLQTARPWLRVLEQTERTLPGPARALGVAMTTAPVVAFLDADAVPDAQWLDKLRDSLGIAEAVGGAVLNGTPTSIVGTAGYLLEFLRWSPDATAPDSLVSCNLLVRRSTYEETGGMPSHCWPGEDSIFTCPLMQAGRAAYAPEALVTHLNRTSVRTFVRHQYRLGRSFSVVCRYGGFRPSIVGRRWMAPASGAARWSATMRRISRRRDGLGRAVILRLVISIGLVAWSVGLLRGPDNARR
jgi:glycosyltransferase involved in cell wall biosynthesis